MDSVLGRFTSEDPLGRMPLGKDLSAVGLKGEKSPCNAGGPIKPFKAGDYNLSRYVLNSPLNYRDPDGLLASADTAVLHRKVSLGTVAGLYILGEAVRNSLVTCTYETHFDGSPGGRICFYLCSDGEKISYVNPSYGNCSAIIRKDDPRIQYR
jgi:hypothetical protein